MTNLYIVGAGGFGRELYSYAVETGRDARTGEAFEIAGFVDDRADALAGLGLPVGVVAGLDEVAPGPDDRFVIGVGDPVARWRLARGLCGRGATFATVVHPTAHLAVGAHVEEGAVIGPFAFVSVGVSVGRHALVNTYASMGHDAVVGPYAVLAPYAVLNGGAILEDGAFAGTHATVLGGRRVGAWARLGAGAVALADVPACARAVGVPAVSVPAYTAPDAPA